MSKQCKLDTCKACGQPKPTPPERWWTLKFYVYSGEDKLNIGTIYIVGCPNQELAMKLIDFDENGDVFARIAQAIFHDSEVKEISLVDSDITDKQMNLEEGISIPWERVYVN